jgi:hypothetical protein
MLLPNTRASGSPSLSFQPDLWRATAYASLLQFRPPDADFTRSPFDDVTGSGGAREAPRAGRSEAQESLFEAVEEGVGALLGHAVHVV